jgi:hypothetical protein
MSIYNPSKKAASSEPENFGQLALSKKGRELHMPHSEMREMPQKIA